MSYNYKIVCCSKTSDWVQVIKTGLDKENAQEMLAELNASGAKGLIGETFYITK